MWKQAICKRCITIAELWKTWFLKLSYFLVLTIWIHSLSSFKRGITCPMWYIIFQRTRNPFSKGKRGFWPKWRQNWRFLALCHAAIHSICRGRLALQKSSYLQKTLIWSKKRSRRLKFLFTKIAIFKGILAFLAFWIFNQLRLFLTKLRYPGGKNFFVGPIVLYLFVSFVLWQNAKKRQFWRHFGQKSRFPL